MLPPVQPNVLTNTQQGVPVFSKHDGSLYGSRATLTAVSDDPDGGVALTETRDGSEAHLVGLGPYEFSQVMRHELSFVDVSIHGDLLLPPTLQPHLVGKRNHKGFRLMNLRSRRDIIYRILNIMPQSQGVHP